MKLLFTVSTILLIAFSTINLHAQNVGDPAPDFFLQKLDGGSFHLSDHKGKVVFIFFFGYACPHCLSNGPNTQSEIYEIYQSNSDFVAVGVDTWDGNSSGVSNFKASTGIQYQLCLMGSSVEASYQTTYDRIIVIDKDGIIRYKATSNATISVVEEATEVIDTYLEKDPMKMMGDDDDDDNDDSGDDDGGDDDGGTITSVETEDSKLLNVFPVPTNNELNLSGQLIKNQNLHIKIIDLLGKINYEGDFSASERLSIPVSQIDEGIYLMQLTSNQETFTRRIMIKR